MERRLERAGVLRLLGARGEALRGLYRAADGVRRRVHGDAVHIRVIIEVTNICMNRCLYCGIRAGAPVRRYRMGLEEVLGVVREIDGAREAGTVVLQGGEGGGWGDEEVGELVRAIRVVAPRLAITLSFGNRGEGTYAAWRAAGMDRYLLRFETSDAGLFRRIHPDCTLGERLKCLEALRGLGVQTGSGFMVGVPGETVGVLADNLLLTQSLGLDMVGIGPFIPAEGTPLSGERNVYAADREMPWRALAVLRLLVPRAHIPATTALDAFCTGGRLLGLRRGANVYMPNATPAHFRGEYRLYTGKVGADGDWREDVARQLAAAGRVAGEGRGDALGRGEGGRGFLDGRGAGV